MRVEQIRSEAEFFALGPEWNALLALSAVNTVFLTWEWISSWWASYRTGKKLWVLVLRDEGGCCKAIAPLYVETVRSLGRQVRRLRFIGDGSWDSDYLDFIISRGNEAVAVDLIMATLESHRSEWDALQLNETPEPSPVLACLREAIARSGWLVRTEQIPCAIAALPATWNEYLAGLRPRFRTSLRSHLRMLEEWGGEIECLDSEAAVEEWLQTLFSLHAGRWQTRKQAGVFVDASKREFYRRMCLAFLRRGWLHFTRLRLREAMLALQFGFIYDNTYHQLQEGFDHEASHASPGMTLRTATIRDLIANGIASYDFLGGVNRHKTDWGAGVKHSVRMAIAPPHSAGYWYVRGPEIVTQIKKIVKEHAPTAFVQLYRRSRSRRAEAAASATAPVGTESQPVDRRNWRHTVATMAYESGALRAAGRFSRARARSPKFAILSYHRIGTGGVPLFSSLPREVFEGHIRFLKSRYRLVSLDEVHQGLTSCGPTEECVAITFDDGYRDLCTEAMPVLRKYEVPASVFLPVNCIESGQVPWYDEIHLALQVAPGDKLDLMLDRPRRFMLGRAQQRVRTAASIVQLLRTLPDPWRREICDHLRSQVKLPSDQLRDRMLNWQQIRDMQNAGVVFGSHTLSHPAVGRLSHQELHRELAESKRILEERLEKPVLHFAYPFGSAADNGSEAAGLLPALGYNTAVTTVWGLNLPGADLFKLRRVSLEEEQSIAMFAFKLTRLFLGTRGTSISSRAANRSANGSRAQECELDEVGVKDA